MAASKGHPRVSRRFSKLQTISQTMTTDATICLEVKSEVLEEALWCGQNIDTYMYIMN